MTAALHVSALPLPLVRRGKVREVYDAGPDALLLVASDRVSAFDVVMNEAVPLKGAVLTQLSAFWFRRLERAAPSHFITACKDEIVARLPVLANYRDQLAGRAEHQVGEFLEEYLMPLLAAARPLAESAVHTELVV